MILFETSAASYVVVVCGFRSLQFQRLWQLDIEGDCTPFHRTPPSYGHIRSLTGAFMRARKRMQAARESVPDHIRKTAEGKSRIPASAEQAGRVNDVLSGKKTWKPEDETEEPTS